MSRNLFVLILLCVAGAAIGQTPEPARPEPGARAFSMFFDSDGGYLGVQTVDVNKENIGKFGLRDVRGVAVESVADGSPAQAAGLQAGDVIVKFNGENVTSVRKLSRLIGEVAPDHQVRLGVVRGGDEREITATLGKRAAPSFGEGGFTVIAPPSGTLRATPAPRAWTLPAIPNAPGSPDALIWRMGSSRQIGVSVSPLTKQLGDHFGVADGKGLLVSTVRENSPAAKAGLRAGDVIVEVNGKPVSADLDLINALSEKSEGDISLTVVRDRQRRTMSVTPEARTNAAPMMEGFNIELPDIPKVLNVRPAMPRAPDAPVFRIYQ